MLIIYAQLYRFKLATIVEGDLKAPFSVATTSRCWEGRYSFPWIAPLYPWSIPYNAVKQGSIKYHFWVFGMTRLGIEPQSSGPLANTVTAKTTIWFQVFLFNANNFWTDEILIRTDALGQWILESGNEEFHNRNLISGLSLLLYTEQPFLRSILSSLWLLSCKPWSLDSFFLNDIHQKYPPFFNDSDLESSLCLFKFG